MLHAPEKPSGASSYPHKYGELKSILRRTFLWALSRLLSILDEHAEKRVAREIRKLAAANEILRGTTKALPKDITKMSESGASIELADYVRAVMGLQPNHGATLPKLLLGVFKAWLTAKLKKISKSPASS